MNGPSSDNGLALSGIRILDFGQGAIDPLTTSYLADFGAEVIKVESYSNLDFSRRGEHFADGQRDPNRNFLFSRYNQNKFGVLINLRHSKGVALAKRLVTVADVVMENFTVGVFERIGLSYEQLRQVKPDIIMLSASFAGRTGPYREFRGQGFIIHSLQGLNDLTGWPDRSPISPAVAFGDHYLPWMWATIILSALELRCQTGEGQYIDGSSLEGCLDVLDTAVADYDVNSRVLTRSGNRHRAAAPHGVYRCRGEDRWCAISVFGDDEWKRFGEVLGEPPWTREEKYSTLLGRLADVDQIDRLVEDWTMEQRAEDVMFRLQQAGIAAGLAQSIRDLEEDPQLRHRQHFWQSTESGMEKFTFESPSARMSKTPARFQRPGPLLGEHNDYVFMDLLGMDSHEYAQLVEEGVIG